MTLYVSRNAVPYIVYPFMGLLFPFFIYTAINNIQQKTFSQNILKSLKCFLFICILLFIESVLIIFSIPHFTSRQINFTKEIIFIPMFIYLISSYISTKSDFMNLLKYCQNCFFIFSTLISIIAIIKFFYIPHQHAGDIWGSSLVSDYNFFSLFLFIGLVFGSYDILTGNKKFNFLNIVSLLLIASAILLSGSRRAFIFMLGFYIILFFMVIIRPLYKLLFSNNNYKRLISFFLTFFIYFVCFLLFLWYAPIQSKQLAKCTFVNENAIEYNTSMISYRIITILPNSSVKDYCLNHFTFGKNIDITLYSSREPHWKYAKSIFFDQYTNVEKFFGKGFSYFDLYKKGNYDHYNPHNLLFSLLLFSGLIGTLFYLSVIIYTVILYFKYFKDLFIYLFLFLIVLMFNLFSILDYFGSNFYIFLFMFPFLFHYLKHNTSNIKNRTDSL